MKSIISLFSFPNYKQTVLNIILIDVHEGLGAILSANNYMLFQSFFSSTNSFIMTFIDDIKTSIHELNLLCDDPIECEKLFVHVVKFHVKVRKNLEDIARLISTPIFTSDIFNQIIMFCSMYQIHMVSEPITS